MPRPSLGVIFRPEFPPETLADYARRAEAAGFQELWLWDDCFQPGALTSAALALSATQRIKVGIGLIPAVAYNPLFSAMEITTLARVYPGRFLPGFGHGVASWMQQIGAAPKSSLKALEETVSAVRRLLQGETVTMTGDHVHLDKVKMTLTPDEVPPIYVGAMREKTLQLAGRVGDGTILTEMSTPAYVRWAQAEIKKGASGDRPAGNRLAVFTLAKVSGDGTSAREVIRRELPARLASDMPQFAVSGIAEEASALMREHGVDGVAAHIPEAWIDELTASGTPEQATASILRLGEAGADSVILQPIERDPACLDEYIRHLQPLLAG